MVALDAVWGLTSHTFARQSSLVDKGAIRDEARIVCWNPAVMHTNALKLGFGATREGTHGMLRVGRESQYVKPGHFVRHTRRTKLVKAKALSRSLTQSRRTMPYCATMACLRGQGLPGGSQKGLNISMSKKKIHSKKMSCTPTGARTRDLGFIRAALYQRSSGSLMTW